MSAINLIYSSKKFVCFICFASDNKMSVSANVEGVLDIGMEGVLDIGMKSDAFQNFKL